MPARNPNRPLSLTRGACSLRRFGRNRDSRNGWLLTVDVGDTGALVLESAAIGSRQLLPAALLAAVLVCRWRRVLEVDRGHRAVGELDSQAVHLSGEAGGPSATRLDGEEEDLVAGVGIAGEGIAGDEAGPVGIGVAPEVRTGRARLRAGRVRVPAFSLLPRRA